MSTDLDRWDHLDTRALDAACREPEPEAECSGFASDAEIHPNRLVRLAVWAMLAAFIAAAITNGW